MNSRKNSWELMLISFIALFLELAIIRWLSAEIRIFAYFKNLPLMAAYLGFGIGFLLHDQSDRWFQWFPRFVYYLVLIIAAAAGLGITHVIFVDPRKYFLLGVGFGDHAVRSIPSLVQTIKALLVIVSLFFLVMATFAALASKVGALLNKERPLAGYSINVAGSSLGILAFSLVSYLQCPPAVWLVLVFCLLFYFYWDHKKPALLYFLASVVFVIFAAAQNPAIWSPYYRVSVVNASSPGSRNETQLYVNYDGFQAIQDLSQEHMEEFPEAVQRAYNRHYNIPYLLSKRKIESVLILGGGSGNDAAAALRNGASRVDVVEIDPVIARLGGQLHPERPYSSIKVNLHIDDARSFLQKTARKYDLVVFATLDSHAAFSSLSSLRLDNFVFTRESIHSAKSKLNPGGGIAINFFAIKPWLSQRHFNTLRGEMGVTPLAYRSPSNEEAIFLAGECFDPRRSLGVTDYQPTTPDFTSWEVESTSDEWPFLFLEKREIPFHYLLPLFIIFALAFIPLRKCQLKAKDVNWHLFFMGAAFLLVETKAVTTLALIFGSTWMVNSIVIGAILITILLANLLIGWLSFLGFTFLYSGLFATLLFNFFFSFDTLNHFDWNVRLLGSSAIIAMPIFSAALIFAKSFAAVESPTAALASNLFGGLVGGLLEYLDMWTGLRWLNMVALFLYFMSMVFLFVKMRLTYLNRPELEA